MNDNTQGRGGRGRSGRGRSYGNDNNNDKNNKKKSNDEKNKIKIPEEASKELGQNVHVIGKANQADEFVKTTEAIMNCTRANCKRSEDVVKALRAPEDIDWKNHPDKPKAPTTANGNVVNFNSQAGYECKVEFESFQRRKEQCIANESNAQGSFLINALKKSKAN